MRATPAGAVGMALPAACVALLARDHALRFRDFLTLPPLRFRSARGAVLRRYHAGWARCWRPRACAPWLARVVWWAVHSGLWGGVVAGAVVGCRFCEKLHGAHNYAKYFRTLTIAIRAYLNLF